METTIVKVEKSAVQEYNHAENVASIKNDFKEIRSLNAEYAVKIGRKFILAKENVPHGKWLETLEEIDIMPRQAQRLMKIAEMFGDNTELIEGMSQRKAYFLTTLPDENIIQLKHDGLVMFPDGTTFTLAEYRDITVKNIENRRINDINQKNKELRTTTIERDNYKAEIEDTRVEYEKVMKQLEELPKGENETLYKEKKALEQYVEDLTKKMSALDIKMKEMEEQKYNEQEILEAMSNANKALFDAHIKINNVKIEFDNRKLRAKILAFFQESRQLLNFTTQNYEHKIDESIDNDSTHQSTG